MRAGVAAEVVAAVHLGYLVYAAAGGFLALRWMGWLWPHLASTVWTVTVTLTQVSCPLTAVEKRLLVLAGEEPYAGSFTAHYLRGVLYPAEYETAVWLGGIGLAFTSYGLLLARCRAARALSAATEPAAPG